MLKKLASQTALYGVSSIIGRVLTYFLVPLHTDLYYGFSEEDYGSMTLFYAYVAFLNIVYTYGMETTYFRYASKKESNPQEIYRLVLTSILLTTCLLSGLFLAFSQKIATALGEPDQAHFVIWLVLIISIDALLAIPYARLRLENKARTFALTKIANIVLTVLLNLFFLVFCKEVYEGNGLESLKPFIKLIYDPQLGIGYVFLANLLANAFVFLMLYKYLLDFRLYWDWAKLKPMLLYAYPLLFTGLAAMVNNMIDKIMLDIYLPVGFYPESNREIVGIYGACFKLSVFMSLAIQAFRYAAEPFFFSQAEDKKAPQLFARVMHYFIITCVLLWLGVSLNLDIFKWIFLRNPVYHEGILIVPILLLANLLLGVYYNLTVWFKLTDQTYYGTYISIGGALLTVLLNFALIPVFGYFGPVWAVLITYSLMCVACYYLGQKYFPIPYQWGKSLIHLSLGGILIYVSLQIPLESLLWKTAMNAGLFLLYLVYVIKTERPKFKTPI